MTADRVSVPSLSIPPPIVEPEPFSINKTLSAATVPGSTSTTELPAMPAPLMVMGLMPVPSITSGPEDSESTSVPDRVIVCGVPKTVGSNVIRLPAGFVLRLARLTTYGRLPDAPEPIVLVAVESTK